MDRSGDDGQEAQQAPRDALRDLDSVVVQPRAEVGNREEVYVANVDAEGETGLNKIVSQLHVHESSNSANKSSDIPPSTQVGVSDLPGLPEKAVLSSKLSSGSPASVPGSTDPKRSSVEQDLTLDQIEIMSDWKNAKCFCVSSDDPYMTGCHRQQRE